MTEAPVVLKIEHLDLSIIKGGQTVPILHDINLEIRDGEWWAIAGESGAGKSMTMYALTSLLPEKSTLISGKILYREEDGSYTDLLMLPFEQRSVYCARKVSLIFQDSINALNPFETIGSQWQHTLRCLHPDMGKKERVDHIKARLLQFGITDEQVIRKYPHQLSGGMRQRIAIAMALESDSRILIADEPTTSLDTINQRKVVDFIQDLCRKRGLTLIYISHNLALLDAVCTHAAVIFRGHILESGTIDDVFHRPRESYTKELIDETMKLAVPAGITVERAELKPEVI